MISRLGRHAAVAGAVAVALTGAAAQADASVPGHATGSVRTAPASLRSGCTGWNGPVYISISGGPGGFTVSGKANIFGHIQITGPNGLNVSSAKDLPGPALDNIHGTGAGRVYVTGWSPNANGIGWHSMGQPSCAVY